MFKDDLKDDIIRSIKKNNKYEVRILETTSLLQIDTWMGYAEIPHILYKVSIQKNTLPIISFTFNSNYVDFANNIVADFLKNILVLPMQY